MAQFRIDRNEYLGDNKTLFETNMISTRNGVPVSNTNPFPVTLGSDSITITGSVNVGTVVEVSSNTSQPVHTHLSEVGTSGILDNPYLPVSLLDSEGNPNSNSSPIYVHIDEFPTSQTINGTVSLQANTHINVDIVNSNPIPISANTSPNSALNPLHVSTVGGSAQGKLWTLQVAQGLIVGHTTEQISGYNPSTSAGDAVWSGGTAYPWSNLVTAQTLYLKSSTNNATDRGMSILIDGLDSNYNNQTEVLTLNGTNSTTAVASTKQFLRIHSIMCNGTDTNVGDITTHVTSGTGTIVSKLSAGRGRAQAGVYTVPAGYTGYLFKGDASSTAATVVNFMGRYFGKAFMVLHVAIVDNSTYIYDFPFPLQLPEKTDIYTVIESGSGKTAVNYEILLVQN